MQLSATLTLTLSGYVATRLSLTVTLTLRGYAATQLQLGIATNSNAIYLNLPLWGKFTFTVRHFLTTSLLDKTTEFTSWWIYTNSALGPSAILGIAKSDGYWDGGRLGTRKLERLVEILLLGNQTGLEIEFLEEVKTIDLTNVKVVIG